MANTKLAAANMTVAFQDKEANLKTIIDLIDEAGQAGVDFLVLPEVAVQGYISAALMGTAEATEQMRYYARTAEPIPGPTTELVRTRAREHGMFVQVGLAERALNGDVIYNSVAIVGPQGVIGSMRKLHNPFEFPFFNRGAGLPVYELPFGRVGPFVCYDLAFPEVNRVHALLGAHICALSTAWPMQGQDYETDHFGYYYDLWSRANASANQVWMVASNHCERRDGFWYYGHSRIIDPNGYVIAEKVGDHGLVIAEVDINEGILQARTDRLNGQNLLRDRRPEHYGPVADVSLYYPNCGPGETEPACLRPPGDGDGGGDR